MNRRIALKNIALATAGLMMLPGCDGGWTEKSVQTDAAFLSRKQEALLADIAETFIPATDTPGAKALKVDAFIQKMVVDCYEKEVQGTVKQGLAKVEDLAEAGYDKRFADLSAVEREEILQQLEQSPEEEQQSFYSLVKGLTIHGYMTSEYVMTNIIKYEMVPGRYLGCVPVTTLNQSQS